MAWSGWIGHTGLLLSPVPTNFTFQNAPAAVRRSSDFINVYARGNDDTLQQFQWVRGTGFSWWITHTDGGLLFASPSAGSIEPGQEHVIIRGTDDRLWWKEWREGRGWTIWDQLGGNTTFQDSPAVVSRSRDVINVYARGNDNSLMQISWERDRGWRSEWQTHTDGGLITAAPSAVALDGDTEMIFARGTDGNLWHKWWHREGVLTLPLHLKYVPAPSMFCFTTEQVIAALELVYAGALVYAPVRSVEQINNPGLLDINSGACEDWGFATTLNFGQSALFSNRNNAGADDIVVYFVRSASGWAGCAVSLGDQPGVIVTQLASAWVATHEVGHKIGLGHDGSTDHIMFRVDSNTNLPPNLPILGANRFIRRV